MLFFFFFFNDTATTEIYTLSLHDALPISLSDRMGGEGPARGGHSRAACGTRRGRSAAAPAAGGEWESTPPEPRHPLNPVTPFFLEKKKKTSAILLSHATLAARRTRSGSRV